MVTIQYSMAKYEAPDGAASRRWARRHMSGYTRKISQTGRQPRVYATVAMQWSDPLVWPVGWIGDALVLAVGSYGAQGEMERSP